MCTKSLVIFRGIILGCEYAGKKELTDKISKRLKIRCIDIGEGIRREAAARSHLASEIAPYYFGKMPIPDKVMMEFATHEITRFGSDNWLLSGFPENLNQAKLLQKFVQVNAVFFLNVNIGQVLQNAKYNWIHKRSGRLYTKENPPKYPGLDTCTMEPLSKRKEDDANNIKRTIAKYDERIAPVLDFYEDMGILKEINGLTDEIKYQNMANTLVQFMPEVFFGKDKKKVATPCGVKPEKIKCPCGEEDECDRK